MCRCVEDIRNFIGVKESFLHLCFYWYVDEFLIVQWSIDYPTIMGEGFLNDQKYV